MQKMIVLILFALGTSFAGADEAKKEASKTASAIFAGGCFWCMEPPFDKLTGVLATTSGYTGGHVVNPTYKQVTGGSSGHYEVVKVDFDPGQVSFNALLEVFWKNIDPLDAKGQFCDKGPQYLSAIFFLDDEQRQLAQASLVSLQKGGRFNKSIATKILPASKFYAAEAYHQDYYKKNPIRYKYYRTGCGRDRRLFDVWGFPGTH